MTAHVSGEIHAKRFSVSLRLSLCRANITQRLADAQSLKSGKFSANLAGRNRDHPQIEPLVWQPQPAGAKFDREGQSP
jgi:hypothetical protein